MSKVDANPRTVRQLLSNMKYSIDYYQREYEWTTENISELLTDLEAKFSTSYDPSHDLARVKDYASYFLGPIVISERNGLKFVVDGQQRLTSLTLLVMYLIHNLSANEDRAELLPLVRSRQYGKTSFNIDGEDRVRCMESLYQGQLFDPTNAPVSARNIVARYGDIEALFPDSLKNKALLHFAYWLMDKVVLVEITAEGDEAYTIFETMNDRGLSLNYSELLKGYLLANVVDEDQRKGANATWKRVMRELSDLGKDDEADFFKAWLRAKYAQTIRERRKDAKNEDFEQIVSYHKWIRDRRPLIGLKSSDDIRDFIENKLVRFARLYEGIRKAAQTLTPGLEYIYFNANNWFTLQYPLLLAPIRSNDGPDIIDRKLRLVAGYLDIFIARRVVNFRTLGYSAIVYTMFNLMKEIRDLDVAALADLLRSKLTAMTETFDGVATFYLHQQNSHYVHHVLARITHHIEQQSGVATRFETYVSREISKPFEIEHIWAAKFERHVDEFATPEEFESYRNRLGNLILLPRGFNQSLGDADYSKKVHAYFGQNLLAKSLCDLGYQNNPSFLAYVNRSELPFQPYPTEFKKADLDARQNLYRRICEEIWSPARFELESA